MFLLSCVLLYLSDAYFTCPRAISYCLQASRKSRHQIYHVCLSMVCLFLQFAYIFLLNLIPFFFRFMTLFAYRFPLDLVYRIMDVILAEGAESVLRFALALVGLNFTYLSILIILHSLLHFSDKTKCRKDLYFGL